MFKTNLIHYLLDHEKVIPNLQDTSNFTCSYVDDGIFCFTPKVQYRYSIVISVGIHGNETAPIELLSAILTDLYTEKLLLKVRLLLVVGNIPAIQQGKRYIDYDLNRMFSGQYAYLTVSAETQRAQNIEHAIHYFFKDIPNNVRYHYDLHTAIRASKFPTFAVLPVHYKKNDLIFEHQLQSADLDALVFHHTANTTLTHFTSTHCHAQSVTLELGKANRFGNNNLFDFLAIDRMLRSIINQTELPERTKIPLKKFDVIQSIIKKNNHFKMNVEDTAPNFTEFQIGEIIATTSQNEDFIAHQPSWILFPNPNVAIGLRAGLILIEKPIS